MNRSLWRCVGVVALVFAAGLGALAEPCTITVQPGESIQETIDAASPGDVICLAEGEWEENLVIERSFTLRAAEIASEPQAVIRSARDGWPVILIRSEESIDVTIRGIKIAGAFGDCCKEELEWICAYGISVSGKARATIEGNTISGNAWPGISMWSTSQATIEGNTISGSVNGIEMWDSSQATIEGNTISGNAWSGIEMGDSTQATIEVNTISENWLGIFMWDSAHATIEGNTISGNAWSGIEMGDSAQASIENNVLRDNERYGIALGEPPCADIDWVFAGYVTGKGNTGESNAEGDYCPEELAFLFTEEGGELDRRE